MRLRLLAAPLALAVIVLGLPSTVQAASPSFTLPEPGACRPPAGASPAQWQAAIGLPVPLTGTAAQQTIAILEMNQTPDMTAVTAALAACGLPGANIPVQSDASVPPTSTAPQLEATGDTVIIASALAQWAQPIVVNTGGGFAEMFIAGARACGIQVNGGPVAGTQAVMRKTAAFPAGGCIMSSSHGIPESLVTANGQMGSVALDASDVIDDLADLGVIMVNSAGDSGSGGCTIVGQGTVNGLSPTFPASHPSVVAVGGTQWATEQQTLSGIRPALQPGSVLSQWVWKEAFGGQKCTNYSANGQVGAAAGGGGFSSVFQPNAAQTAATSANYPNLASRRLTPDIAALAGWPTYSWPNGAGGWATFDGTSGAAPSVAAGLAQVNASLTARGLPPLTTGGSNDVLAALYGSSGSIADVTLGGNDLMNLTWNGNRAWAALNGYDMASGLGVPNFAQLASALAGSGRSLLLPRVGQRSWPADEGSILRLAGGIRVDRDTPSAPVTRPSLRRTNATVTAVRDRWIAPTLALAPSLSGTMQVQQAGRWISVGTVTADGTGVARMLPMRFSGTGTVVTRILSAGKERARVAFSIPARQPVAGQAGFRDAQRGLSYTVRAPGFTAGTTLAPGSKGVRLVRCAQDDDQLIASYQGSGGRSMTINESERGCEDGPDGVGPAARITVDGASVVINGACSGSASTCARATGAGVLKSAYTVATLPGTRGFNPTFIEIYSSGLSIAQLTRIIVSMKPVIG